MKIRKQKGYLTDNFIINSGSFKPVLPSANLPDDLIKQEKQDNNSSQKALLGMVIPPLAVLGGMAGVTWLLARKKLPVGEKLPAMGRNINIESEQEFATYAVVRDPNVKNILGAIALFTFSSAAFALKNTVDGIKEIWVKQKEADIKRNYQEKMIGIETRSFSGKKQIIRYMLDKKEKELTAFNKMNNIAFSGSKKNDDNGIKPETVLLGAGAVAASALLVAATLKNIRKIGKTIKEGGKTFSPSDSIYENPDKIYGTPNKITFFTYINELPGHFYNFVMNPSKYTAALFGGLAAVTGIGYAGARFVEANKEVQVKKAGSDIDVDMHDKLVSVELRNFMTKKESAVGPLVRDYKKYAKTPNAAREVLKTTYNGIFNEIKNGPPFVYD